MPDRRREGPGLMEPEMDTHGLRAANAVVRLFRVIQPVPEIEVASAFYAALLGDHGQRVSPGRHYFDCGGVLLACYDAAADGDGGTFRPAHDPLYFAVAHLEATWARAREAGAEPSSEVLDGAALGEIGLRPWGERSVYARDPFGNPLCLVDQATVFRG